MLLYDDLLGSGDEIYFYDLGVAPNLADAPQVTAVGTARFTSPVTITGTNFGATEGQVTIGGVVQPILSWSDTSIVVSAIARGTLRYGAQSLVVRDSDSVISNPFSITLLPQTGWLYVNLVAPLATSGERLTATPDLANTDQVAYGAVTPSGTVTVATDGSFTATSTVGSFSFEVNDGTGWGSFATQTITEVASFTGLLNALASHLSGSFVVGTANQFSGALQSGASTMGGTFLTFVGVTFNGQVAPGLSSMQGSFSVTGETTTPVPPSVPTDPINPQSKVGIVNLALTMLGVPPIQGLQDQVKAARVASLIFDAILDQELARHFWRFALARRLVDQALSDEPRGPFQYVYPLPADWLTTVWLGDLPTGELPAATDYVPEWSHEGRQILTNEAAPISLLYVRRVLDSTQYHALFIELLSARLGMEMADSLTNSTAKWEKCRDRYREALREARRMNAIMNPPRFASTGDSWLDARH